MNEASTTSITTNDSFTSSAGKQLGLYTLYALLGLVAIIYMLSVAAGNTGSNVSGGAVNVERNHASRGTSPARCGACHRCIEFRGVSACDGGLNLLR